MSLVLAEMALIVLLILANGVFSMSELAVLSARKSRLRQMAREGRKGAAVALELAEDPNRFLPTVQVGITLVGVFTGALGGATIAALFAGWLERHEVVEPYAEAIALGVVVVGITVLTLVLGELVPKRVALSDPERIAARVARPLAGMALLARPAVRLLGWATERILKVLRVKPAEEATITVEEIDALIRQGTERGVFQDSQRQLVKRVFRLGDRTAGELMTPRTEILWIDVADPPYEIRRKIASSPHSRFLVSEGALDNVLGIVQVKNLLVQGFRGQPFDIRGLLMMPLFLYEGTPGFQVLEKFKSSGVHIGIVLDEYGSVEGIITLNDILEAIVGDLPEGTDEEPMAVQRGDGSWLFDGRMPMDEAQEILDLKDAPEGEFHTMAGFVIDRLGRIPATADSFVWEGRLFEVVDMDGRRVDKILISPAPARDGERNGDAVREE